MKNKSPQKPLKRQKINILGVKVDDLSFGDAIGEILRLAQSKSRGRYVVTVNAEFVMKAKKDPNFAKILKNADIAVADGWWVVFSKQILGGKYQDRITGVDLVNSLCQRSAKKPIRIGFLGGFSDVATLVAKRQGSRYAGVNIVFAGPGDPAIGYDLRLKKEFEQV